MFYSKLIQELNKKWFKARKKTIHGVQSTKDAIFHTGILIISGILIVWISIFLYTAFYYAYMPSMTHVRPVHLQFKSCENQGKGVCSFPAAYIQLTKKQQLLMVGQPYKISLNLEMPESRTNKELGMFMVCAQLKSRDGILIEHSCRSAMLHYRSSLLHILKTLTFSPMMIFGTTEEKQNIILELFSNFEEDQSHPLTMIYVEIQSRNIEFYSASLSINAHLSGLRYLMFHWPVLSSIIGIGTNLFFIVLICVLSYVHFANIENDSEDSFSFLKGEVSEETEFKLTNDGSESSSLEYLPMIEDVPKPDEKSILNPEVDTYKLNKLRGIEDIPSEISSITKNKSE